MDLMDLCKGLCDDMNMIQRISITLLPIASTVFNLA